LIDGFIRPVLGDTPISRLCRLGPRPFEQLYADLPPTLPRPDPPSPEEAAKIVNAA
jgi:hypothetical protein